MQILRAPVRATALLLCSALLAACGDDGEGDALKPDLVEEADAATRTPADAGTSPARDAAPAPVGDAAIDRGAVEAVSSAGMCSASEVRGDAFRSGCPTEAELGAAGCEAAGVTEAGRARLLAAVDAMRAARHAVTVAAAGRSTLYLCTGTPPASGWLCGHVALVDCSDLAQPDTCSRRYLLSPMPVTTWGCSAGTEPTR